MKRLLIIAILFGSLAGSFSSCKKFFDKPEGSDITIDSVFSSKDKSLQFLWRVYTTCSIYEFPYYWDQNDQAYRHYGTYCAPVACASDEADAYAGYAGTDFINKGNWGPTTVYQWEFNSSYCYKGIRNANLFIENIDKSPYTGEEIQAMKAEAIFLRALMHFDLMQRLGGVPIVDKSLKVSSTGDLPSVMIPRNTFKETVDFIVHDCEEAAKYLPNVYPSNYKGRIVKGAALALKARTLLYAASPLFNTAQPYMATGSPELICYGNYDANRWKLAADASKAVIDWATKESGWCDLYRGKPNVVDNYEEIFINPNVNEIILDAGLMGTTTGNYFVRFMTPGKVVYTGSDPVNIGITLNFTKFYQKNDGTEQTWDEVSGTAYPYTQYKQKMKDLEPRFQASVFTSGTEWSRGTGQFWDFYNQTANYLDIYNGVGYMRKFLKGVRNGSSPAPRWITFRLAEFYLNYAEALNEINGSASEIEQALRLIRERAGMPAIQYTNQDDMRQKIRRERGVELAFEEHRYFDVRRWRIAAQEGVMKGGMYGLRLFNTSPATYKLEKFEDRVWDDKMYLYPFKQSEVNLGYITQNPGW